MAGNIPRDNGKERKRGRGEEREKEREHQTQNYRDYIESERNRTRHRD